MDPNTDMKCAVRRLVTESKNALANPEEPARLEDALCQILGLLPSQEHKGIFPLPSTYNASQARAEFMRCHYADWLECLLGKFSVEWLQQVPSRKVTELVDVFFLDGGHHEAFLVLSETISNSSGSYRLHKCVSLLETFLRSHKLRQVLWDQCRAPASSEGDGADRVGPDTLQLWQQIITHLVTLPDRVLAKLHKDSSELFYPKAYIALLVAEFLHVLCQVKESLEASKDCSVQFASQLLGRLCLTGHADTVWEILLPSLVPHIQQSYVWCRVCERLVTSVPDRCMESTVTALMLHVPWYGIASKLLGHSALSNNKLQYLLTNKLLLLRYFSKDCIIQNIIGYLASSPSLKNVFIKVWLTLLDVWGDSSAVRHTSYEQHVYVSKAILVCLAFTSESDRATVRPDTLTKLMKGVQCHLDSPIINVRRLGMVVAEQITAAIGPQGQKLQFEYEKDEEVDVLLALVLPPVEPDLQDMYKKMEETSLTAELDPGSAATMATTSSSSQQPNVAYRDVDSELDSDDDLEPYDLSGDVKVSKVKAPVYLRDCIEGLLSSEDPDRMESCLTAAEKLVRENATTVQEVAVEFCKILLHLQDNAAIEGFLRLRFSTMVALGAVAPKQVAEYLSAEFYERNYNLRQRMDMLEVLGAAAQELSQPATGESPPSPTPAIQVIDPTSQDQNWRQIVEQRIEKKTRRFAKGRQHPEPQAAANRFAAVAGDFFFPLIRFFDRKESTLDLLGSDHLVLSRLIYTLGVITYAAINTPILRQIVKGLLEFIWVIHYHPQPAVRRALLFAVSMVILSLPSHMLLADFQADVIELKSWLEGIFEKDVDQECRKMVLQALVLLENSLKRELEPS